MDHELRQAVSIGDVNTLDQCRFDELTVACSRGDPLLGNEIACRQRLGNGGSRGKRASDGNQSRELHSEPKMRSVFGGSEEV